MPFGFVLVFQLRAGTGTAQVVKAPALVNPIAFDPAPSLLKVGSKAPDFTVQDALGLPTSLSAERGHPVLLEFFAVWCPVCHRETPVMHRLAATFGTHGLHTLAVLANPYGQNYEISQGRDRSLTTKSDLRWYASAYHANYPLLIDKNFHAVNRYGAGSYPTIYVIDAAGKVAFAEQGQVPYKTLAGKISSVLK